MKAAYQAAWLLFVFSLPLLLFTTNLRLATTSYTLYSYGLEKYGAAGRLGVEGEEVRRAARELIHYWGSAAAEVKIKVRRGGEEVELFNAKEVAHLRDVKRLIGFNRRFHTATLAYALLFAGLSLLGHRPGLFRGLRWGGRLTLGLLLALGLGMALSFDRLFTLFHLLSFPNLLWILDPATDRLIQMFPAGFFQEASLMVAGATAAQGLILWWIGAAGSKRLAAAS